MRIAVLYNPPGHVPLEEHWLRQSATDAEASSIALSDFRDESEYGVAAEMQAVADVLGAAGHDATVFAVDAAAGLCGFLEQERPDLIFNRCELFLGRADLEMNVAAMFELFGVPFTGSPAATLATALDKGVTKAILDAHDIPTAPCVIFNRECEIPAALRDAHWRQQVPRSTTAPRLPMLVKPLREDGSLGIDVHAVVNDEVALARRVRFALRQFHQPAMAEEFIEGRELIVAVMATTSGQFVPLPITEILFDQLPPGTPRIVGYEAKWLANSPHDRGTVPCCPAELDATLADRVRDLAVRAAGALGLRDYGRVDFRVRNLDDEPFVLEVNPNPDLSRDAGFMRAAKASGRSYAATVCEIVNLACARYAI